MAVFSGLSAVGPAAASYVSGAAGTEEQGRQEKLTMDQEALKMYTDLMKEGWKPVDPKRGTPDGTVMQVGKVGWLQMPKFGKQEQADLETRRMQVQLRMAELQESGLIAKQQLDELRIAAQKAQNAGQLRELNVRLETAKQQFKTEQQRTLTAAERTKQEQAKRQAGIPDSATYKELEIGGKTVPGFVWMDDKGPHFAAIKKDGKIVEAPRQLPPQSGPAAYKTAENEITMNPEQDVTGSVNMMNSRPGSTKIYFQEVEEGKLWGHNRKTYHTTIPMTTKGKQYDAPTVMKMYQFAKSINPGLTFRAFLDKMHNDARTPADQRYVEVVK